MKKFLAFLLAAMLLLSVGAVAVAEEETTKPSESGAMTFTFSKTYQTTKGATPATIPNEELSFTVTPAHGNPDTTTITISDTTLSTATGNITVNVPSYSKVGKWNYTGKENAGTAQGVTYSNTEFGVQVLVTYPEDDSNKLVAQTVFTTKKDQSTEKVEGIVNTYDLGSLTVTKKVDGNLASPTQKFDFTVTFTSEKEVKSTISGLNDVWMKGDDGKYTATQPFSLAHGETQTFSNIPVGVTYTVVEDTKHAETDANGSDTSKGYTLTYKDSKNSGTIAADTTDAIEATNTKGTTVDTGITTDSLPYVMLLGFVILAGAALIIKRRVAHN